MFFWLFESLKIFNAEDAASQTYLIQNGKSMFRAISEVAGNSVLSHTRFTER